MKALLFYAITAFALNAIKAEDQQCPELNDENISCQDMSYLILENNGRNVPLGLQCMGYAKYLSPTFAAAKQNINLTTLIDFEFELLKLTQLDQEKNVRLNYYIICTQCLKITQNVALAFSTNFCPIKSDMSGNTV